MQYAIYGSLGIAEHVIEALSRKGTGTIALVVDEENRVGETVSGFTVQPAEALVDVSFNQIIIATMAFPQAVKKIYALGYAVEQICDEVWWDPFFIQLEPTTKCNFSCLNCSRKDLPPERKNRDLDIQDFTRILAENPQLKRLQLQGLGEPLLNAHLAFMLKEAKQRGISTSLTTNAAFLNKELGKQIAAHLDKIVISLDAVDNELFSQLRKGGNWEEIRPNIEDFLVRYPNTKVAYNCVITAQNIWEIDGINRYALATNPFEVHFQLAENWYFPGQQGFKVAHEYALLNAQWEEEIFKKIAQWLPRLQKKGIRLTYTGAEKRKGFCWWPFYGMFVSVDGYVTPCCIRMQPEVFHLGNLFERSLQEIWYSGTYMNFRKSMFRQQKNKICDYCPL